MRLNCRGHLRSQNRIFTEKGVLNFHVASRSLQIKLNDVNQSLVSSLLYSLVYLLVASPLAFISFQYGFNVVRRMLDFDWLQQQQLPGSAVFLSTCFEQRMVETAAH
jgi:hypothetical protein